jgi:hypothetical protein
MHEICLGCCDCLSVVNKFESNVYVRFWLKSRTHESKLDSLDYKLSGTQTHCIWNEKGWVRWVEARLECALPTAYWAGYRPAKLLKEKWRRTKRQEGHTHKWDVFVSFLLSFFLSGPMYSDIGRKANFLRFCLRRTRAKLTRVPQGDMEVRHKPPLDSVF